MSKASQSASAPSHVRFSALDVDAESGHAQPSAPPSRWFDPVFLRKVVLAQALFCCVVLIPLAVAVAWRRGGSGSDSEFGPVDPPGSLANAVKIDALMATLEDLQEVANAHNGTRCVTSEPRCQGGRWPDRGPG